ncbi:5'-nucleotidase C-terminal domain-containing protein [uncultured Shewanella sp.]|uniref:bifunctional metallophosphatase/5'-nucleotidase n=1 Tax=uncultured Shewanella sp. TaxID=173975 RepID=UPI002639AF24|nr:5'-nucleotidase C-terminal domain-containing protein [uncultured Shewanella sp.]
MTDTYCLTLAHINDTHSHFDPNEVKFHLIKENKTLTLHSRSGGYARLNHRIKLARQQAKLKQEAFLFLHGGDSFEGTLYYSQFKGKANSHLLNLLQPDAMVLGNHEMNAGNAPVKAFLDEIHFPLLAGNMDLSLEAIDKKEKMAQHKNLFDYDANTQTAKVLLKPLQDKTLAIIGITLEEMHNIARPDPDTQFRNAIKTTLNTIEKLKQQGIVHIILLSHLGIDQDRRLAERLSGISLIVGGHSHSLQGDFSTLGLNATPYGEKVNNTYILHAGKYAETLGLANITFNRTGQVITLEGHNQFMLDKQFRLSSPQTIEPEDYDWAYQQLLHHEGITWDEEDETIETIISTQYRPTITRLQEKVLGVLPQNLIHIRVPSDSLPHGSEICPWVCRSMYHEVKALDHKLDFALHNAGGVRESLSQGNLTLAEVIGRILPFELPLVTYEIEGQYLFQTLEAAINLATNNNIMGSGAGGFPYTYGLRYIYDGRAQEGERITSIEIFNKQEQQQWQQINRSQSYIGVSSDYTVSGKEGYHPLLNSKWVNGLSDLTLPEAFIQHMSKNRNLQKTLTPNVYYTSHV